MKRGQRGNRETRETIRRAVTNERRSGVVVRSARGEALGNLVERTTETTEGESDESYFSCGGP